MIAIGTLIYTPAIGLARVFGNYGTSVGLELLPRGELCWLPEDAVVPHEPPTEDEVAYG